MLALRSLLDRLHDAQVLWVSLGSALAALLTLKLVAESIRSRMRWSKMPPGPKGLPFVGNILQVLGTRPMRVQCNDWKQQYGPIYSLNMAGQPTVVLNTKEAVVDILERRSDIWSDRAPTIMGGKLMSGNMFFLFTPAGSLHTRLRRSVQEGLTIRATRTYHAKQEREASVFLHNMMQCPETWHKELDRTFLSSILSVLCGWSPMIDVDDPAVLEIKRNTEKIALAAMPGAYLIDVFPALLHLPKWLSKWRQEGELYYNLMTSQFERILGEVRDKRAEMPHCYAMTMLDKIDKGDLSTIEASWVTGTLLSGAADTTGHQMRWFIMAMLLHPEIMRRAHAELDTVVGRDRMPTFEDADHLPYVSAMVKETLRWQTIAPLGVAHRSTQDCEYKGYVLPKGTVAFVNVDAIHHGDDYDNSALFQPERFLDDSGKLRSLSAETHGQGHLTYGFGKRVCPGMHFANQSLFISMASLLWAFKIEKLVGIDGQPVIDYETTAIDFGTMRTPLHFNCTFTPRFADVATIVSLEFAKRA